MQTIILPDDTFGEAAVLTYLRRMYDAAAELAKRCVTPIVAQPLGGQPSQFGTGTFFRIGERRFLISAAHVFRQRAKGGFNLTVFETCRGGVDPINLEGEEWRYDDPEDPGSLHDHAEPADVSVVELSPETATALSDERFLTLQHVQFGPIAPGVFAVMGFPLANSGPASLGSYKIGTFSYAGPLYDGPVDAFQHFRPDIHILIRLAREGLIDRDGSPAEMEASLGGISGCSIWQLCRGFCPESLWTPDKIEVVAVQTGTYRAAIQATRWQVVADLLWFNYPDLRGILSLNGYPGPQYIRQPGRSRKRV